MTNETLNTLFHDGEREYLSRTADNVLATMQAAGITDDTLTALIEAGAIKVLDFGEGQVHLERQVFSQEALNELFENQKITTC